MRRHRLTTALIAAAAALAFACADDDRVVDRDPDAPAVTDTAEIRVPEGATREQVEAGEDLFVGEAGCHACHGRDARGTGLAPDLADGRWINVDAPSMESLVALIRQGVTEPVEYPAPMPPMGGVRLNDEQMRALAAFVLSLGG